ncbi:MAG TPA: class I SAM-dependent methyltransferase [Methylomirabilota bacterium]|nr:class I SAM-dependent methyltransferase [Methylomirabilota bacterium]
MAKQQDIEETYNFIDEIFCLSFGENADLTCAWYNGDFSKNLVQAQEDKHDFIISAINFKTGSRVLDIGCGLGSILKAVKERGGHAIGLTLSRKQVEVCRRSGLEAYLKDWKEVSVATFGSFDGIVSVGAFEHFCSVEDYLAGKQDQIYDHFFRLCYELLPAGGRLYLQTMMWGKNAPDYSRFSLKAKKGSNEYMLAVGEKFFPGSWLSFGEEHILRMAKPYFELISDNNGRLDYIETAEQWHDELWKFSFPKLFVVARLLLRFLIRKTSAIKLNFFVRTILKNVSKKK